MKKIIVTDLTRFANPNICCLAGIDMETGECIRPLPYLEKNSIISCDIKPGTILRGNFDPCHTIVAPHTEDHDYEISKLEYKNPETLTEFYSILEKDSVLSIEGGFNTRVEGKKIKPEDAPSCSIITLKVPSNNVEVIKDNYGKIRVHLTDETGNHFNYLSLTDLKTFESIMTSGSIDGINNNISRSTFTYLRIGLSRIHEGSYWLQVNGIYPQ